jgi:N-acetylmuramoyl-L-alanine amidase
MSQASTLRPEVREQAIELVATGGIDSLSLEMPLLHSVVAVEPEIALIYDPVTGFPSYPLPDGEPLPLGPGVFNSGFRDPLPRSPVWNPAGPKRVGLQVGHWNTYDLPYELRRLSPGSTAGGWTEAELNLLLARTTARFLEEAGIEVDILPTAIPVRYRAHAFVSIHADGDASGRLNGYKLSRPAISSIPEADDEFVRIMYDEYGAATGMARDSDAHISRRMLYYYAFNTRRYQHAIDLGTPAMIIETGFLTNASDRAFLTGQPERAGRGIANGIIRFLELELGRTGTS